MIEIQGMLFDEQTISKKVKELANRISIDYAGKDLVLVCILKGAVVFMADLMRCLSMPIKIDFVRAASYGVSTEPSRNIIITKDIETDIKGKHVLLVDTIIDTGETLHCLLEKMRAKGPASLETVVLLDKKPRRTVEVTLAYKGFDIPDVFVVGYGVDCAEQYRNLPYIAMVRMNPDS
ncbi:MAG TPA: hypoxanthine phosphoribosyltransferase [Nitrospirota bacterium]|nr:hypoxanthine phosphoribosyltransferase [Nitrospirota bacterium]